MPTDAQVPTLACPQRPEAEKVQHVMAFKRLTNQTHRVLKIKGYSL